MRVPNIGLQRRFFTLTRRFAPPSPAGRGNSEGCLMCCGLAAEAGSLDARKH